MEKCNYCEEELEWAIVSDAVAGDVYFDAKILYCPKCLCVFEESLQIHK